LTRFLGFLFNDWLVGFPGFYRRLIPLAGPAARFLTGSPDFSQ